MKKILVALVLLTCAGSAEAACGSGKIKARLQESKILHPFRAISEHHQSRVEARQARRGSCAAPEAITAPKALPKK